MMIEGREEVLEGGAVLHGCDEGRLFMAIAVDLEKVFGRSGGVVSLLHELEGQDWVLRAVNARPLALIAFREPVPSLVRKN